MNFFRDYKGNGHPARMGNPDNCYINLLSMRGSTAWPHKKLAIFGEKNLCRYPLPGDQRFNGRRGTGDLAENTSCQGFFNGLVPLVQVNCLIPEFV